MRQLDKYKLFNCRLIMLENGRFFEACYKLAWKLEMASTLLEMQPISSISHSTTSPFWKNKSTNSLSHTTYTSIDQTNDKGGNKLMHYRAVAGQKILGGPNYHPQDFCKIFLRIIYFSLLYLLYFQILYLSQKIWRGLGPWPHPLLRLCIKHHKWNAKN